MVVGAGLEPARTKASVYKTEWLTNYRTRQLNQFSKNLMAANDGVEPSPSLLESEVRDRHTDWLNHITI